MQADNRVSGMKSLPVVLIAAVIQGWALYLLHQSVKHHAWPTTHAGWLFALYAVAVFVPLTTQWFAGFIHNRATLVFIGAIGVAYFYFGWHYGVHIHGPINADNTVRYFDSGDFAAAGFIIGVLWLLFMPFVQARLIVGKWTTDYSLLFTTAWHNKLILAEAALFTGLFWLLLGLWQMLFHMLGIGFFRELFAEPMFVYPVTSITFGVALHLIGSIDKLTKVILEQSLSVLKWLAIVAGFILTIFTLALLLKLPGLVFHGNKAIGAAWLLWLVAVNVLLINAAFKDGSIENPYPKWIAFALRCVLPLTVIISVTALLSLTIRVSHYGLTVERFWALITAITVFAYSLGYSYAALQKGTWLQRISRVNIGVALMLIAVIGIAMTPVLSPYRLAALSQFQRAQVIDTHSEPESRRGKTAMHYLRFNAGRYGVHKLEQLTVIEGIADAERIRVQAKNMLVNVNPWEAERPDTQTILASLVAFPKDQVLDGQLRLALESDIANAKYRHHFANNRAWAPTGFFIDLTGDGIDEFAIITQVGGLVYQNQSNNWRVTAAITHPYRDAEQFKLLLEKARQGQIDIKPRELADFEIAAVKFTVQDQ